MLDRRKGPEVATETMVELASIVLENNYFEFNDEVFRQRLGTAIGTKFAPVYANPFLNRLEERPYEYWDRKHLVWMRYIDEIFFLSVYMGKIVLRSLLAILSVSIALLSLLVSILEQLLTS